MPKILRREVTQKLRSEIVDYLSLSCDGFSDTRLGEFLGLSVGRILLKESRLGRDWRSIAADGQLHHIADWLKSSIVNDDAWLSNVDAHGRPKKLMKFGSIDQIVQEADKAMLKAAQRLSGVNLVEGDEEIYAELDDGYHIVRLLTPAALDRESAQMQHCIGGGAYDEKLIDDCYLYLSLRDAASKPHATMEVRDDTLVQLQGKQNETPVRKYLDRLIPFIKKHRFKVGIPVSVFQRVVDDSGHWHALDALPDGLTVSSILDFRGTDITSLPDGLTVGGSLNLSGCNISSLPEGLSVGGELLLKGSSITSLPENISVRWTVNLNCTAIKRLPYSVSGCGNLFLEFTDDITLPEGLTIRGCLALEGSGITFLPRGLSVGVSLFIKGTSIAVLPDDLSVGGDLNLRGTSISEIPAGVTVGGKILSDNPLLDLRPNLSCR